MSWKSTEALFRINKNFFLPEREYMELELRSVEVQGAHEIGGRALGWGRGAPPYLVDRLWAPGINSFAKIYY